MNPTAEEIDEMKKWLTRKMWYAFRSEYRRRIREQSLYPKGVYTRQQLDNVLGKLRDGVASGDYSLYEIYRAAR